MPIYYKRLHNDSQFLIIKVIVTSKQSHTPATEMAMVYTLTLTWNPPDPNVQCRTQLETNKNMFADSTSHSISCKRFLPTIKFIQRYWWSCCYTCWFILRHQPELMPKSSVVRNMSIKIEPILYSAASKWFEVSTLLAVNCWGSQIFLYLHSQEWKELGGSKPDKPWELHCWDKSRQQGL